MQPISGRQQQRQKKILTALTFSKYFCHGIGRYKKIDPISFLAFSGAFFNSEIVKKSRRVKRTNQDRTDF